MTAVFAASLCRADVRLDLDSGATWIPRNRAAFPGDSGDRFDLARASTSGPAPAIRAEAVWPASPQTEWRLLAAPFRAVGSGRLDSAVSFGGMEFQAGDVRGRYRFDSYRLTFRSLWKEGPRSRWMAGGTLKVRDAEIGLDQGGESRRTRNTGFVPLLHIAGIERLGGPLSLELQVDGLWAPQGYAIEGEAKAVLSSGSGEWFAAVRILDGGADNDEVYAFASLASVSLGLRLRF
jgi:hypothetical protein